MGEPVEYKKLSDDEREMTHEVAGARDFDICGSTWRVSFYFSGLHDCDGPVWFGAVFDSSGRFFLGHTDAETVGEAEDFFRSLMELAE